MLRSARNILSHRVTAADGDIGRCVDFVIDAHQWRARYLVVECGGKLRGRRVLISPLALNKAAWTSRRLVLDASRAQVEAAPVLDAGAAISSEHELALYRHYGWSVSGIAPSARGEVPELEALPAPRSPLCSALELLGYGVRAEDGDVGQVGDFVVDDDTWSMPFLVMEGRNWLSARKVLVPTDRVLRVHQETSQVEVALTIASIEAAPEYDPSSPSPSRPTPPPDGAPGMAPSTPPSSSGVLPSVSAWFLGAAGAEAWGTRGLRAALARIIQG